MLACERAAARGAASTVAGPISTVRRPAAVLVVARRPYWLCPSTEIEPLSKSTSRSRRPRISPRREHRENRDRDDPR